MIYSLDSREYIKNIPHRKEYDIWRSRMSVQEYAAIIAALNARIEADEIVTSSWIPGSDWTGTVYEPIYSKACCMHENHAAMFFGLLVWEVVLNREDVWSFGRYEKSGVPIEGMTYFKLTNPPQNI